MDAVVFRLCDKAPDILREVCLERGWEEYREDGCEANGDWNLWWKTQGFTSSEYENCRPWQRLNHFPKSSNITKKDGLARNLRRMKTSYGGSIFDFFPRTFILPNEYKKFVAEFSKQDGGQRSNYWICKPTEQSCGRGIFIFQDLHDLTYDCAVVVQKYIIKPLLISGYKFDLRLYAIVTSFHPFQLYIYHKGIVRFSTERFDLSELDNRFSHLTNTSINKTGPHYSTEKESIGVGCKWTLSQLRLYFYKHNIDDRILWHRITSIIIITLLSLVQDIPSDISNCFEVFGFDILVDEKMKPWLLEVNFSPALGNDCIQDELVKRPLLNDILEILNFSEADIKRGGKEKRNSETRKKSLKANKDVMCSTPKSVAKSLCLASVGKQSSKSCLAVSAGRTEPESKDLVECSKNSVLKGGKHGLDLGLKDEKISKDLQQKTSVFGASNIKAKKLIQRCQAPCSEYNQSRRKEQSTSEEFLKAAEGDCEGMENSEKGDLRETKIPLNCTTKGGDSSSKNKADDIPLAKKNKKFPLENTSEHENGHGSTEQTRNPPRIARITNRAHSSMDFSTHKPELKGNGLSSYVRIRRYNSEVSSLNSLKSVDKHVLPHSSTGNLHRLSSKYSPRVSSAFRCSRKTCDTLKPQIGNCILAFPFNEVTHKISQGKFDQKVVVEEIRKTLRAVSSHIKSSSLEICKNGSNSPDLSKPFWGYRSEINTFYSSLQSLKVEQSTDFQTLPF